MVIYPSQLLINLEEEKSRRGGNKRQARPAIQEGQGQLNRGQLRILRLGITKFLEHSDPALETR